MHKHNLRRSEQAAALNAPLAIGDRWSALTVVVVDGRWYDMRCDCGAEIRVRHCHLPGKSSCGCRIQRRAEARLADHPMYSRWRSMKSRVTNKNVPSYPNYGGRGIGMCDRWLSDFWQFVADIGEQPSSLHELDRIDNDGDYEPGNIRWVRRAANQRNQRRSCKITLDGVDVPVAVAAHVAGVDYFCLHGAYRRGNDNAVKYLRKKGANIEAIKRYAIENRVFDSDAAPIKTKKAEKSVG